MEPLDWQKAGFEAKTSLPPNYKAIERAPISSDLLDEQYVLWPLDAVQQGVEANVLVGQTMGAVKPADMVNLPPHYARFPIEPIRFIGENKLDWFQGNIVKYVCRHDAKNGLEDIAKVIRYAQMYKLFLAGVPDWWKAGKPEDFKP